jgi:hypothetical protein
MMDVNLKFSGVFMKTRIILTISFFVLICTGTISAQQNKGFIRSTFSHGIHFISSQSPYATPSDFRYKDRNGSTMEIDFVHSTGLTMGLSAMFLSNDQGSFIFPVISVWGYTYDAGNWCTGVKMLVTAKHLGFNINGTYWFIENMGIGIVFNMLFSSTSLFSSPRPSEGYIILPGIGWSIKF